jgi:AraC-like DNA-binding protein
MYREHPSRLAGATMWEHIAVPAGEHRVLPDGSVDLIWLDGDLLVAGPDTVAKVGDATPGSSFVGLRFAPGTGPAVLGLPAHELRDLRVPLADLWPASRARRLAGEVGMAGLSGGAGPARGAGPSRGAGGGGPGQLAAAGRVLERIAADRLDAAGSGPTWPDRRTAGIVARLRLGGTVAGIAAAVGWNERRLHRHCLEVFGYGAKTLGRILRMTRALDAARTGRPLAEVAAGTGYADQAHLTREVRALAGLPPAALLAPADQSTVDDLDSESLRLVHLG